MSSVEVRTKFKDFLIANAPTEKLIDLSAQFALLQDLIEAEGLDSDDPWLGVQFIGADELPITLPANNSTGKYRETGAIYLHCVDIAKLGVSDLILARAEVLRDLLRGANIDGIRIESVTPANFEAGAALRFEGGYISGSFLIGYEFDKHL